MCSFLAWEFGNKKRDGSIVKEHRSFGLFAKGKLVIRRWGRGGGGKGRGKVWNVLENCSQSDMIVNYHNKSHLHSI